MSIFDNKEELGHITRLLSIRNAEELDSVEDAANLVLMDVSYKSDVDKPFVTFCKHLLEK